MERLEITKAKLNITTKIHNADHGVIGDDVHAPLGSVVHDTATVTGAVPGFAPTGAISFTLNNAAVGNVDPHEADAQSQDSAPLEAGSYTYNASIAEDANYFSANSADEPLIVDKKDTEVVTQVHNAAHEDITGKSVTVGDVVHDSSVINGAIDAFSLTGTVSYRLYNTGDCTGDFADAGTDLTIGDESSSFTTTAAGSFSYKALYSGGANYNADEGECEPFSVTSNGTFCSPGFWKNAPDSAWAHTGILRTASFNSTVYPSFYDVLLSPDQTLQYVLDNNSEFPEAGPFGLTGANAVGAFLSSQIDGWTWDGTEVDTCPIDHNGDLTPPA